MSRARVKAIARPNPRGQQRLQTRFAGWRGSVDGRIFGWQAEFVDQQVSQVGVIGDRAFFDPAVEKSAGEFPENQDQPVIRARQGDEERGGETAIPDGC